MKSFLAPLVSTPAAPVALVRVADGTVVASQVEPALESAARRRGLLGRDGLAAGAAIAIAPSNAVHTFFMRFAIDVVFVTRDGRVVKIARDLAPWRLAAALRAYAAIEFAAGSAARSGLAVGDVLKLEQNSARPQL